MHLLDVHALDLNVSVANCSMYNNCFDCAHYGCGWCGSNNQCLSPGINTCLDSSCFGYNSGSFCPSQLCSTYNNCFDCNYYGCGWCDSSETCMSKDKSGTYLCYPLKCLDCWKPNRDYFCPSYNCSVYKNCFDCTYYGCGWCDETLTCLPQTLDQKRTCLPRKCNDCWKTDRSIFCPSTNCSIYKNCFDCNYYGCGWCASSQTCTPRTLTPNNTRSCLPQKCNENNSCFKVKRETRCPSALCHTYKNCFDCTYYGCGWCPGTGTCEEIKVTSNSSCLSNCNLLSQYGQC